MLATLKPNPLDIKQRVALLMLSLFYLGAGIAHLIFAPAFVSITPGWVPSPSGLGVADLGRGARFDQCGGDACDTGGDPALYARLGAHL